MIALFIFLAWAVFLFLYLWLWRLVLDYQQPHSNFQSNNTDTFHLQNIINQPEP